MLQARLIAVDVDHDHLAQERLPASPRESDSPSPFHILLSGRKSRCKATPQSRGEDLNKFSGVFLNEDEFIFPRHV